MGLGTGILGRPALIGRYSADWFVRPLVPPSVQADDLIENVELRRALDDQTYVAIARALRLFCDLDAVPETAPAKVLGYFSVLESLLAHAPSNTDPVDSITRQLKRNLVLLDHRMPKASPCRSGGSLTAQVWRR